MVRGKIEPINPNWPSLGDIDMGVHIARKIDAYIIRYGKRPPYLVLGGNYLNKWLAELGPGLGGYRPTSINGSKVVHVDCDICEAGD